MYHVGVSNIFELLDDENDEEGKKKVVRPNVVQKETSAPPQKKVQQPTIGKSVAPTFGKDQQQRKNDFGAPKGSQQVGAGGAPKRFDRPPKADGEGERRGPPRERRQTPRGEGGPSVPFVGGQQVDRKRDNKEREHGKFTSGKPTKRTYDRRSGTGRGKEVKKGGGGRGGWGKEGDGNWDETATAVATADSDVKEEVKVEGEAAPAEPQLPTETEDEKKRREEEERKIKEEEEKEARQMTLEEYNKKKLEEKAEKGTVIPDLPAPRKPGEGVDKKELQQWAKFTALKREDDEEEKQAEESKKGEKKKDSKKQAIPVDQVLRVQAKKPERERRDRGDRGDRGERGDRGDRGDRGGEKGSPRFNKDTPKGTKRGGRGVAAPDVGDTSSFPALNTKA